MTFNSGVSDYDTLQLCWYSCSHHPEEDHMCDRNMLVLNIHKITPIHPSVLVEFLKIL